MNISNDFFTGLFRKIVGLL